VSGITAAASIVAERDADGVTRLPVLSSQVPLVLRRTVDAVYLVGGAAGPLGGDDLTLTIDVREGARLRIRTAAASVALPSLDGAESRLRITATVGAGARLEILPEPVIIADGARHRMETRVTLAAGAALVLREVLILGRHGESGGGCVSRIRADYGGAPLLRHELSVDGADQTSLGPAILAGNRSAGSVLIVEPSRAEQPASAAPGVAVMPLAGPAVLISVLAPDAPALWQRLDWALGPDGCGNHPVLGG
jgi:urease accessory protein